MDMCVETNENLDESPEEKKRKFRMTCEHAAILGVYVGKGWTVNDIAEEMKVRPCAIAMRLKNLGLSIRRIHKIKPNSYTITKEFAEEAIKRNFTIEELMHELLHIIINDPTLVTAILSDDDVRPLE